MDFVSKKFLADEKAAVKDFRIYFNIYQQLGLAWEFLGLQCGHWDGYKKIKAGKEACKICGKIKGVNESYCLLPKTGKKIISRKSQPDSERIVELKESGITCSVDQHLIHVTVDKKTGKMKYGGFPWEIQRKHLKKFPVIFDYDDDYNFLGLMIFKGAKGKS